MKDIDLFFETPALLLAAIPAVLLVAAGLLLRREKKIAHADRAAAVLRAIALAVLVVIAAGPGVTRYLHHTETVILADRSGSVQPAEAQIDAWIEEAKRGTENVRVIEFAAEPAQGADPEGTDVAAAIDAAGKTFSQDAGKRIVLISDGLETQGDALAAAKAAAEAGVRIDAIRVRPDFGALQTELAAFEAPVEVMQGRHAEAKMTVLSSSETQATLRITDDGAVVYEKDVELAAGRQEFSCVLKAQTVGEHALCAELIVSGDTLTKNNSLTAAMNVSRGEKILLVDGTGGETEKLRALLEGDGAQVTVCSAQDAPAGTQELCEYGLIVLMNVNVTDLPEGFDAAIEEAVTQFGRSVLTTGGENTYLYGGMKDSRYEQWLPVRMSAEEKESVDPVALLLVIDTTDSMTRESAGVPIEMARRGAIKCIDELNGNDYAGVITFSDEAELTVPITPMRDKAPVLEAVNAIETADPDKLTKFSGALHLALETLKEFDGTQRKHVMFITDGSPADAKEGFKQIAKEMSANGITMSAIVVGRIVNVVAMLEELTMLGGGRCYPVENGKNLSNIMTVDSVLSQVEYTIEDPFKPQRGMYDAAFAGEEEIAQLYGYVRTSAKADANVLLSTPEGRPIYATRSAGSGTAASFMSDLSGDWSRTWYAGGQEMILRMINELLPGALTGTGDLKAQGRTSEYDLLGAEDGGAKLMEICAGTGGTVFETWEEAERVALPPVEKPWDPVLPLSLLAILCLSADIALRKLKRAS